MSQAALPLGVDTAFCCPQPWATLVVEGPVRLVNLRKPPAVGLIGKRIAIYAGEVPDLDTAAHAMEYLDALGISDGTRAAWRTRAVHGALIGTAVLAGVLTESTDRWFRGPFAVWLTKGQPLADPIPAAGRAGFWRLA